jgi:hypothetical protein
VVWLSAVKPFWRPGGFRSDLHPITKIEDMWLMRVFRDRAPGFVPRWPSIAAARFYRSHASIVVPTSPSEFPKRGASPAMAKESAKAPIQAACREPSERDGGHHTEMAGHLARRGAREGFPWAADRARRLMGDMFGLECFGLARWKFLLRVFPVRTCRRPLPQAASRY